MSETKEERWWYQPVANGAIWRVYSHEYEFFVPSEASAITAGGILNALESRLAAAERERDELRAKAALLEEVATLFKRYRDGDLPLIDLSVPLNEATGLMPSAREWLASYDALIQQEGKQPEAAGSEPQKGNQG